MSNRRLFLTNFLLAYFNALTFYAIYEMQNRKCRLVSQLSKDKDIACCVRCKPDSLLIGGICFVSCSSQGSSPQSFFQKRLVQFFKRPKSCSRTSGLRCLSFLCITVLVELRHLVKTNDFGDPGDCLWLGRPIFWPKKLKFWLYNWPMNFLRLQHCNIFQPQVLSLTQKHIHELCASKLKKLVVLLWGMIYW